MPHSTHVCSECGKPASHRLGIRCAKCVQRDAVDWLRANGYKSADERLELYRSILLGDEHAPAICEHGCHVEPDGHCQHGQPAITLAMGLI